MYASISAVVLRCWINREVATFRVISLSSDLCSDLMFQVSTCKAPIYSRVKREFSVLFECAPITATKAVEGTRNGFLQASGIPHCSSSYHEKQLDRGFHMPTRTASTYFPVGLQELR
jgi:hypothetical protein